MKVTGESNQPPWSVLWSCFSFHKFSLFTVVFPALGVAVDQSVYRLGYGLGDRGSIPNTGNDGNFSLRHSVQTGSGAHLVSYPMGTGGSHSGGNTAGAWS